MRNIAIAAAVLTAVLCAQGPVINPRGVVNTFTLQPAPSAVAAGGLLTVRGFNLGPAEQATATAPWPTELGGVSVTVNERPAALRSVSVSEIVLQVPAETRPGLARVVVTRGGQQSRPAVARVLLRAPSIETANKLGFGEVTAASGSELRLAGTGIVVNDGVRASIGGLPVEVKVEQSGRQAEQDVTLTVPEDARAGDMISLTNAGNAANVVQFGRGEAEALYVALPEGAQSIRVLRDADLRGTFAIGIGPRADDGCYPSWTFDLARGRTGRIAECLISAQANVASPIVAINESGALAALVGPAAAGAQQAGTNKLAIYRALSDQPNVIELPGQASAVTSGSDGEVIAVSPGPPVRSWVYDANTGEARQIAPGNGFPGAIIPVGPAGLTPVTSIDLGDGLNQVLSTGIGVGPQQNAFIVGDDAERPTRTKLAVLNGRGDVMFSRDFPAKWLVLLGPLPAVLGGQQTPANFARLRSTVYFDQTGGALVILARNSETGAHGFVSFLNADRSEVKVSTFPDGWYAATCVTQARLFNLELSRRLALFGAARSQDAIATPCAAQGFITLDLETLEARAASMPGQGQANVQTANEVNDYVYVSNVVDITNQQLSDTLYVLDGVTASSYRMDLPQGVVGFAGLQGVAALSGVVTTATSSRVVGDAGLVYFDLENERTRVYPVPDGFQTATLLSVFPNTRKIVARGTKADNTGSQILIFDIDTGDLSVVRNPEGVTFVGQLPAAATGGGGTPGTPGPGAPGGGGPGVPGGGGGPGVPGGGGGPGVLPGGGGGAQVVPAIQSINTKANTVAAMGYSAERQPVGIVVVRVP